MILLANCMVKTKTNLSRVLGDMLSNYGSVYAVQQMSVSLAYSLAPIIGGEVTQYIGFRWLMSIVGCFQFIYAVFLLLYLLNNSALQVSISGNSPPSYKENQ